MSAAAIGAHLPSLGDDTRGHGNAQPYEGRPVGLGSARYIISDYRPPASASCVMWLSWRGRHVPVNVHFWNTRSARAPRRHSCSAGAAVPSCLAAGAYRLSSGLSTKRCPMSLGSSDHTTVPVVAQAAL